MSEDINFGAITEALNDKADRDLNNVAKCGQETAVAWGRTFVNMNQTLAAGDASIAGTYNLGFTDGKVRIGLFLCRMQTKQNGGSEMSIYTDVVTTETSACATNNGFTVAGLVTIPFINSVGIKFPLTAAGVVAGTYLKFIGYFE